MIFLNFAENNKLKMSHPKGLYLLFATEMWERFSYYGMRALLILYLTKSYIDGGLGFTEESATLIYGFFTGFVYFTPLIGGWLADRYLGQRRSITIGGILMMLGQFCLATKQDTLFLYAGLLLLIIGNGFFKPNISTLVGRLYEENDTRRDAGFIIFYMGINIGAFFSPLITGYLAVRYGYTYGFLAAGIGMLIGIVIYMSLGGRMLKDIRKKMPRQTDKALSEVPLTDEEKDRTWVIFVIVIFCTIFFAGFEQAGSSMNLYTDKFINRQIGNFTIPTEWFQSLNPLMIVILAPLFSSMWMFLSRRGKEPSIPVKMGLGMILLGVGFFILTAAAIQRGDSADETVKANLSFLIFAYFFHTVGELCLSPIGLSMITKLAPVKLASLLMGVWLMTSFFANIIGGFIASYVSSIGAMTIFAGIAVISIIFGIILIMLNRRLVEKSHGKL
jgi:POT family proton-dependent oligopeptide transporter